jgi:hypothetical protein
MALPRKELVDALVNAFDSITFDRMLSDHLNVRRDRLVAGIALLGFDEIVSGIVQIADERRWAIDLIRAALAAKSGNAALQAFVARNAAYDPQNQPASAQNCFLSVFMRARRVFLKRDEFRDKLQKIGSPNESRVMAIDGQRFTGKTYSRDFLSFLRENEPAWAGTNHQIQYVNMDDGVFEPEDLARKIGTRLGLDSTRLPPDKGEQAARRIPDLVDWLIVGFEQPHIDIWWLILDGFRIQVQPPATHDLIRALIDMVERDIDKVRLILLNYSKHLDLDTSVYILTENIEPIDETNDVSQFFRHVYTLSQKMFTDVDIDQTVTNVLKQVDNEVVKRGPEERMKLLSLGLTKAASELLK